jgi:hypothetical protein
LLLLFSICLLSGCTTLSQSARHAVPFDQDWVVLPFINNTETPYAAERAESVAASLLYTRGVQRVLTYSETAQEDEHFLQDRGLKRLLAAKEWARKSGISHALVGTVTEWRYKVGMDGEPVVGITLQVLDLKNDTVVWSGSAGKSGWSRDAVSAVAQQVMEKLIATIPAQTSKTTP